MTGKSTMKIEKIKLNKEEIKAIIAELIERFTDEDGTQTVEFELNEIFGFNPGLTDLTDLMTCKAALNLYTECSDFDENNQASVESRGVVKFDLTFYHNGDEVEANDDQIYERIRRYYEI